VSRQNSPPLSSGLKLVAYGVDGVPTDETTTRRVFGWAKKMGIEVLVTETMPNEVQDKLCTEFNIKMALHKHPKTLPPDQVLAACEVCWRGPLGRQVLVLVMIGNRSGLLTDPPRHPTR